MREAFFQKLEKRPLVCDGAMGTMLYSKGISLNRCFDELNLSMPALVKEVHLGYAKAGAEILETNTFGANRLRLRKFDLEDKAREINLAGARLAREVAGDELYVAGSVGPLDVRLEPLGATSLDEARKVFREQIEVLVEGGVDLIIVETMIDLNEARQALLAAREVGPLPVVVQMTIQDDGSTPSGTLPEDFARQLDAWGAEVIGLNCGVGPAAVLDTLERMAKVTSKKLSAQPNAGLPRTINGRSIYLCSPEYMASYARRFIQGGARLVGGCCGTTPDHIKAIKAAVRAINLQPARITVVTPPRKVRALDALPFEKRSQLAGKLARNEFPVLVEVIPPKGSDATKEIEGTQYLRAQGVDAATILDASGSTGRMSALTLATIIQQGAGLEVLLQYSCRDRSVLSIQSDLLGAYALGLRNILAVTGDPPQFVPPLTSRAVFEVDAIGLVNILSQLNRGLDVGGNPLGTQTGFSIGAAVNPQALNPDEEVRRFEFKVEAGANFAVTQPVFDVGQLARFLRLLEIAGVNRIPIVASLWPLTSYRNAEFMNNEIPGISVPPSIMERMHKADTGDQARAEGVQIAREILLGVRDLVQGALIAAPFGRYAMAVEVAEVLKVSAGATKASGPRPSASGETHGR